MFKIQILGYQITFSKVNELQKKAAQTKVNSSIKKITEALERMEMKQIKYSEYALQKESGVSINTIKKYRDEINLIREKK